MVEDWPVDTEAFSGESGLGIISVSYVGALWVYSSFRH